MTFILGLVGTDGLVIASDKKASYWEDTRTSSTTRKLYWNEETGIACAIAGDAVTPFIAKEICKLRIDPGLAEDGLYDLLQQTVYSHWHANVPKKRHNSEPDRNPDSKLLITLVRNPNHLWRIDASRHNSGTKSYLDKTHAGDQSNPSKYFLEFYEHPHLLPVNALVFLAAHIVCEAAAANPTGIGGLDMLTWKFDDPSPKIYSEAELEDFKRRSKILTDLIRQQLFDGRNSAENIVQG